MTMTATSSGDPAATTTHAATAANSKAPILPAVQTLFIWDFDWTIVNCNSDEYIPSQFLGDEITIDKFREGLAKHGPTKWHEIVASLVNECMDQESVMCTKKDVLEAAASMPFLIDVRGALGDINSVNQNNYAGVLSSEEEEESPFRKLLVGQAIVSDGNYGFICEYLRRNEMMHYFTHGVESNIAIWEENDGVTADQSKERLRVQYQSTKHGGHSCKRCPPNLCKSQVVNDILNRINQPPGHSSQLNNGIIHNNHTQQPHRPRIVYVGDGSNDACPALHVLNEHDVLLARAGRKRRDPNSKSGPESDEDASEGHGNHAFHPEMHTREVEAHGAVNAFPILSALRKAEKEGLVPKCKVSVWRSGKELRSLVRNILKETKKVSV